MSFSVSRPEWQKGRFPDEWRSLCAICGVGLSVHVGNLKLTSFAARIRASTFALGWWWGPSCLQPLFLLEDMVLISVLAI